MVKRVVVWYNNNCTLFGCILMGYAVFIMCLREAATREKLNGSLSTYSLKHRLSLLLITFTQEVCRSLMET